MFLFVLDWVRTDLILLIVILIDNFSQKNHFEMPLGHSNVPLERYPFFGKQFN
jgi:hypothetical protein